MLPSLHRLFSFQTRTNKWLCIDCRLSRSTDQSRADATAKISDLIWSAFAKTGVQIAARHLVPADAISAADDDFEDDINNIDFSESAPGIAVQLKAVGDDTSANALDAFKNSPGMDSSDVKDQVREFLSRESAALAEDQAAALVTGITETTRTMLRTTIASGLDEQKSTHAIALDIAGSSALSLGRSELIAKTEIAKVVNGVALAAYKAARDRGGITMKKEWMLGDNPCEICQGNADKGAIDLDDVFASGSDVPPEHPNCECQVIAVFDDDGTDKTD
jgi:hypothetical protein